MNSFMVAFGLASVMLVIGMVMRTKIPFLRNMLVPSSVIAGIVGLVFMNVVGALAVNIGTDCDMFTDIVNHLFTVSFISIALTSTPKTEGNTQKNTFKGAVGMGLVWCFLYALTPVVGFAILKLCGNGFDMNAIYGMMVQFAFCQGPGQSAAYGAIFEQYGWANASMVAITMAAIGFVVAYLVGIPAAKLGIKRGIAKHCGSIDHVTLRGYMKPEEQNAKMNRDTTCNSNIETLAFHFAMIGVCYIVAIGIAKLFSLLPSFLGSSLGGMMFMNGMLAAYIVKAIMKKLKVEYLLDNTLQSKITGWTSDYLVVCAFMAISLQLIREWLAPIAIVSVVTTVITFFVCFYFGCRFGGGNDFERTLGLYGTCTGTVPSGVSLVRIVDPEFQTSTAVELGACNLMMMASMPVYILILGFAAGSMSAAIAVGGLFVCCVVYLVALKLTRTWSKPTFSWKQ